MEDIMEELACIERVYRTALEQSDDGTDVKGSITRTVQAYKNRMFGNALAC